MSNGENTLKNLSKANSRFAQGFHPRKLAKLLPCLFAAALLAGCAHRYDITLTNGERVTNVTKPILNRDRGAFYYQDVAGQEHHVFVGRVVEIAPHSNKNTTPGTLLQ
jgi:hypothetical protein